MSCPRSLSILKPCLGSACMDDSYTLSSGELVQQCPGLLEVNRRKPFCEPAIDWRQKLAGFCALALLLPEATQAQRGTEFWHLRLLAASHGQRLMKTALGLVCVRAREQQQQLTLDTISPRCQNVPRCPRSAPRSARANLSRVVPHTHTTQPVGSGGRPVHPHSA